MNSRKSSREIQPKTAAKQFRKQILSYMKLTIIVQNGFLSGKRLELTEGFLTFGRAAACDLAFDPHAENMVSTKHGYIETKPDGFYLVDSKSTNGTFVNGERIQVVKLNSGDVVQFGKNGPEAKVLIDSPAFQAQNAPFQAAANLPNGAPQMQFAGAPSIETFQAAPNFKNSISFIGLNPEIKTEKEKSNKYIGLAIAVFVGIFLSLIVICLLVFSVGLIPAFIASFVAFIPAFFYILPLMWLDRYDPEPPWLLAFAFAWGALVAVIISFIINTLIGGLFGQFAGGVISAPIFEEGSKGLGLILILLFMRKEFDDILDGIVYAGTIALGFATVENVLYYGRGLVEGGSDGLIVLFIMRGILSPFAHVTFTAMTGIGCGIARESHNGFVKIALPILGYICAVALHALWNGMAFLGGGAGFLIGYIVLEIPFFLIFVGFSFYVMWRQNKILREMLAIDVARGLISQEQLETTTSAFKSSFWILGGLTGGKFKARNRFLRAVGKLGLSYWHIQRATNAQGQTASFQQNPILREEVLKWRDKV